MLLKSSIVLSVIELFFGLMSKCWQANAVGSRIPIWPSRQVSVGLGVGGGLGSRLGWCTGWQAKGGQTERCNRSSWFRRQVAPGSNLLFEFQSDEVYTFACLPPAVQFVNLQWRLRCCMMASFIELFVPLVGRSWTAMCYHFAKQDRDSHQIPKRARLFGARRESSRSTGQCTENSRAEFHVTETLSATESKNFRKPP
eukprot:scaffold192029_cov46-Prasinocladus_malaysianus.AAC.1